MTKQCGKCKEIKLVKLFTKRTANTQNGGYGSWCKDCHNAYGKQHRKDNPKKYKTWKRNWEDNNKQKRYEMNKVASKTVKYKEQRRKNYKKQSEELTDVYIRNLITSRKGPKKAEITKELIKFTRIYLKLLRLIKSCKLDEHSNWRLR